MRDFTGPSRSIDSMEHSMNSETPEKDSLVSQVHALERELRRMKRIGIGVVAGLFLLVIIFHALQREGVSTEQVVAKDFVLIDSEGHARARLAVFPEGSGLEAYAASGERRVQLIGTGEEATLNLYIPVTAVRESASINLFRNNVRLSSLRSNVGGAQLEMHSERSHGAAVMALEGTNASLTLSGADDAVPKLWLSANPSEACTALTGVGSPSAGSSLCLHSPGLPTLELADLAGNRAVIGIPQSSDLSGEGNTAASLILKHKSGKKLKVAPQGQ
jgi:hypothetical protein